MKFVGEERFDLKKLEQEFDQNLERMRDDMEALDCSEAERKKLRVRLNKLLDQRGLKK